MRLGGVRILSSDFGLRGFYRIFFYKGVFLFRFLSIFTEKFFKVSGRYVVRDG